MAAVVQGISVPYIDINGLIIPHKVGSIEYTEGKGEQMYTAMSVGGGEILAVYSVDVSKNIPMFKFTVNSVASIQIGLNLPDLILFWKDNNPNNIIIIGDVNSNFTRTFQKAALTTDYSIKLGPEAEIELEFRAAGVS